MITTIENNLQKQPTSTKAKLYDPNVAFVERLLCKLIYDTVDHVVFVKIAAKTIKPGSVLTKNYIT